MASNNYAEVITDTVQAQKVLAMFERIVTLGRTFKVLKFNPDTDRFAISCGRESNLPSHPDVEDGGATLAPETARALWKKRDTVEAVSFGNGLALRIRRRTAPHAHPCRYCNCAFNGQTAGLRLRCASAMSIWVCDRRQRVQKDRQ